MDGLAALGQRPLFSVEGVTYHWADVLASADARGLLDELRSVSRRGLASSRRVDGRESLDPETLRAAAERFRYDKGLLSAEELDAWLQRWGLSVGDWSGYLERSLLLERPADDGEPPPADSLEEDAVDEAVYADAVCSGFLEREALRLAADAALAGLTTDETAAERAALLEQIEVAAAAARAEVTSDADVEREIGRHGLDWTRLELEVLELDDREAAREAALCVRIDGRALADVAEDCREPLERMSVHLADVESELKPLLLAAQPGELVGPIENDDTFVLVAVEGRTRPAPTDPELRQRAEAALVERAVARALQRVEWHEHL